MMSTTIQEHLRESVLKTALLHFLRNSRKSPDRTARNILELLQHFQPAGHDLSLNYDELLTLIQTSSREDCIDKIINRLS